MFVSKVTLAAALMLGVLSGAGVCAYYLRAQEPGAERENPAQPAGKKEADKAPKQKAGDLQALLRERLKLAQDILKKLRGNPRVGWLEVSEAAERVLEADLELCPNKAARIAAHQRHVKVAEELARFADNAVDAGGLREAEGQLSHYLLIDAKIGLEREKARE